MVFLQCQMIVIEVITRTHKDSEVSVVRGHMRHSQIKSLTYRWNDFQFEVHQWLQLWYSQGRIFMYFWDFLGWSNLVGLASSSQSCFCLMDSLSMCRCTFSKNSRQQGGVWIQRIYKCIYSIMFFSHKGCPLESLLLDDESTLPGGYLWQQGLRGVLLERLVTSRDLVGLYQRVKSAAWNGKTFCKHNGSLGRSVQNDLTGKKYTFSWRSVKCCSCLFRLLQSVSFMVWFV